MESENKQPKQPVVATSEQRVIAMKKILAYQREQKNQKLTEEQIKQNYDEKLRLWKMAKEKVAQQKES